MTVVSPTDRPKSVRNRCVIEGFVAPTCYFTNALSGVCYSTASRIFPFLFSHEENRDFQEYQHRYRLFSALITPKFKLVLNYSV